MLKGKGEGSIVWRAGMVVRHCCEWWEGRRSGGWGYNKRQVGMQQAGRWWWGGLGANSVASLRLQNATKPCSKITKGIIKGTGRQRLDSGACSAKSRLLRGTCRARAASKCRQQACLHHPAKPQPSPHHHHLSPPCLMHQPYHTMSCPNLPQNIQCVQNNPSLSHRLVSKCPMMDPSKTPSKPHLIMHPVLHMVACC